MINRGDIKLAIDMVVNAQDDSLWGGEAEYVINTLEDCGNTIAAQAAVIEKIKKQEYWNKRTKESVDKLLEMAGYHEESSSRHQLSLMNFDALAIPTDSTQILEQYVKEKTQAQAAVIEQLTKRLASTNIIMEVVCAIHPDSACAKYELAENMNALALLTDSTQILAEVRRAERERVAQYVQQGTGDWMLGKKIAAAIRAME